MIGRGLWVVLVVTVGCTVPPLDPAGRPCYGVQGCGPGTSCDLVTRTCVAAPQADAQPRDAQPNESTTSDSDGDKVPDADDNCPQEPNPSQADMDLDGAGDACDGDLDGDGLSNEQDPQPAKPNVVYYHKTANMLLNDGNVSGTWAAKGTTLCQESWTGVYETALTGALIPTSDYLVETRFTVQGINLNGPVQGYWPSAGLGLRLTMKPGAGLSGYQCLIDLKETHLVIGKPTSADWTQLAAGGKLAILQPGGPFRLRAIVEGNAISCQLVEGGHPGVSTVDATSPLGSVGVMSDYAKVCFEYLTVIKPP